MAHTRTIKPGFWMDEAVGGLTFEARLLLLGARSLADRERKVNWVSRYLRTRIFTYDEIDLEDIEARMDEVVRAGLVDAWVDDKGQHWAHINLSDSD